MDSHALLLLGILLSSFVTGVVIFLLDEESHNLRTVLNLLGASLKLVLVGLLLWGIYHGESYHLDVAFLPNIHFALGADANSVLFVTLSTVLWFWTTIYAVGYLEDAPHRSRFFGFFSLCVTATTGIALADNLITFFTFYELLTVSTFPLVAHRGTPDALRGGKLYLTYTITGGAVLLLAVAALHGLAGPVDFQQGGVLQPLVANHRTALQLLFLLFMAGIGVKAALFPLHGWLPRAMVAPAPVSALLHAVAVVKAGAFGIVRVVYDVYGVQTAAALDVLTPLAVVAAVTIIYGSSLAVGQDKLKRRLAYSTVSQVSYVVLGAGIYGPRATTGGLVHLVHQGLMKITLFFGAGNYAETLGIHRVSEMNGVGRRMPLTTAAFSVAALGMIGVPLLPGYVSKAFLQQGAADVGAGWVAWVLTASSVLNAIYFLPILYRAWLKRPDGSWSSSPPTGRWETHGLLLLPPLVTAALVLWAGLAADTAVSPLAWVKLVVAREYGP